MPASPPEIDAVMYACQNEHGTWRVAGSRVSMDSIIYAHRQGESPAQIVGNFPSLSLEQVFGAIAFYLHHKQMMDEYLEKQAERLQQFKAEADERNRDLREKIKERAKSHPVRLNDQLAVAEAHQLVRHVP
jgi:uncharacterized protein (DUF433 family)